MCRGEHFWYSCLLENISLSIQYNVGYQTQIYVVAEVSMWGVEHLHCTLYMYGEYPCYERM